MPPNSQDDTAAETRGRVGTDAPRPVRTLIYGSCVSRDTFEHLPSSFELLEYIARQSLISAATEAPMTEPPRYGKPASAFQRRMLEGDWTSSLFTRLRDRAGDIDLLVWDLCDERLGVRQVGGQGRSGGAPAFATRSVDSIRAGLDGALAHSPLIPFGSMRHRLLFNKALITLRAELRDLGLLHRTVLLAPPWAARTESGKSSGNSFGLSTGRANRLFRHYREVAVRVTGIPFVTLPPSHVSAADDHRWGAAPFHYSTSVYYALCEKLESFANDLGSP